MDDAKKKALRRIPKIDELMKILKTRGGIKDRLSKEFLVEVCRETVEEIRRGILEKGKPAPSAQEAADLAEQRISDLHSFRFRPVVNATGIILHTNLGRAPLCEEALKNLVETGRGYSNLEFDLEEGKRGSRYDHLRGILCDLTGAEEALVVNNNAAAVLLVLNTLAEEKEVIVSRGELIEIGGEFRLPEVMEKSNAILREVGTTNRTRLSDYERAINENTGLLMRAHTSNYRIIGFTGNVPLRELVDLGKKKGIPVMDDLGSGCLIELDRFGLQREPTVQETVAAGIDVLTFSGDKLLGGPQAGIILGKRDLIDRIRKNPLNRALRIDKLTIAALEATLKIYLGGPERVVSTIRALKALTEPLSAVEKRAKGLLKKLESLKLGGFSFSLKKDISLAGGGSLPEQAIPTVLISVRAASLSANKLETELRKLERPVIARIAEDDVLLDLRSLAESDFPAILRGFQEIAGRAKPRS